MGGKPQIQPYRKSGSALTSYTVAYLQSLRDFARGSTAQDILKDEYQASSGKATSCL
jgi:hypothetical protein